MLMVNKLLLFQTQSASLQQTALQQTWLNNPLPENIPTTSTTASSDTRRMSEPCHTMTDRKSPPPRPASVTLSPLKGTVNSMELHPNQAVLLDEVGEGEMVENKLVIPDEMERYLNQVSDNQTNDFTAMSWSDATNPQKPLLSPTQMLASPSSFPILPSPTPNLNQMIPSPSVNQMLTSPTPNQMHHSPASNQMIHSPVPNQIIQSPGPNMNQMMQSPNYNNQTIQSPQSNFNNSSIQNPMLSPSPSLNPVVASSTSNHINQMVPSPMAVRCHQQVMSPGASSPNAQYMSIGCNGIQNQMQQNNGHMMITNNQIMPNQCYNTNMNHSGCYNNNWNNTQIPMQNRICQNMQENGHNVCIRNQEYMNQCHQMQMNNTYMQQMNQLQCSTHNYQQMCNQPYPNNKVNAYNCNTNNFQQQTMQNPGYNCMSNMVEPLPSPAMATPAPTDLMNHPQQAQMSRPCNHYGQNCVQPQPQQVPFVNRRTNCNKCAPNCQKVNYNRNKLMFNQCTNSEIQCKDISQSQMSPVIQNGSTNSNGTTTLGMRQDTYQRTLEYVQNCQSWATNPDMVSSSTHPLSKCNETAPSSNMVVNDMTSSLSSLLEENRFLQMIQ